MAYGTGQIYGNSPQQQGVYGQSRGFGGTQMQPFGQQGFTNPAGPVPISGAGPQQSQQTGPQAQNPFQPAYLPSPPQALPTMSGYNTDPSAVLQQIMQAYQPQYQRGLNDLYSMFQAGGFGPTGPAIPAMQEFQAQQAAGLAPSLAQAIEFAQGQGLQQNLANTGYANQFNQQNLQDIIANQMFNASAYNQMSPQMVQAMMQQWQFPMQQYANLNEAMLGGNIGLAQGQQQTFPIYGSVGAGLGGLGQSIGNYFGMQAAGFPYGPYSTQQGPH